RGGSPGGKKGVDEINDNDRLARARRGIRLGQTSRTKLDPTGKKIANRSTESRHLIRGAPRGLSSPAKNCTGNSAAAGAMRSDVKSARWKSRGQASLPIGKGAACWLNATASRRQFKKVRQSRATPVATAGADRRIAPPVRARTVREGSDARRWRPLAWPRHHRSEIEGHPADRRSPARVAVQHSHSQF